MLHIRHYLVAVAICTLVPINSSAQEVCFKDASKKFEDWRAENGKTLDSLSAKFKASKDPYKELVDYDGMKIPIAAALIIEGEKYGKKADVEVNLVVGDAQGCSKQTQVPRGVYDFAREVLGITTVLPEKATRIDFEELRRGNIAGGKESVINKTGRDIDKIFNPFRW
ncbi:MULTISPECIES: hypothetical protein [Rhizobium]|uniref:Uncharacterized protein n=1 Tax=Rhizobium paranaense TaxID=1650438 RepID=A0A7W9D3H7_9HYPH|nr:MULTISPECIES: hypothetical protein [Rhizobium]MBB5576392.1 hypothetical protein [Rhizobium paranaense]PST62568.1 hypothetical protein C9E91_13585 [Rhizobium sp. SEMIA4064]